MQPETTQLEPDSSLVVYVFSNDPEDSANLLFFTKHGIPGCDACDYIIVLNQTDTEPVRCSFNTHSMLCSPFCAPVWF